MVAAEAMSHCLSEDSSQRAASLWLAASHLLSGVGNSYDDKNNYSWVTLRLAALHGVSQQVDSVAAEQGKSGTIDPSISRSTMCVLVALKRLIITMPLYL